MSSAGRIGGSLALFVLYGSVRRAGRDTPRIEPLPGISLPDIAQNLLLYIPFGMLSVWVFRGSVSWTTQRSSRLSRSPLSTAR